jgi:hypothetical protein
MTPDLEFAFATAGQQIDQLEQFATARQSRGVFDRGQDLIGRGEAATYQLDDVRASIW